MLKNYKIGFDFYGLLLFLMIMVPNIIWFIVPAQNDILRIESITPVLDMIASVIQVLFVFAICFLKRKEKVKYSVLIILSIIMAFIYYAGWVLYYLGIANQIVIIMLTIFPCISFISYTIDRKNYISTVLVGCFTILHSIYGFLNFII